MKQTKQLLPLRGNPVLAIVTNQVLASVLNPVIVVLGHDYDRIKSHIDFSGVTLVRNTEYRNGQSTSLATGVSEVPDTCCGAMFLLADQVLIDTPLIDQLVNSFICHKSLITIPVYQKKRGNPVIISKKLFPELMTLTGDTGARQLFQKYHEHIYFQNVETDSIHLDMDTEEEYIHMKARFPHDI